MVLLWIKTLASRWRWRYHAWKKIKFSWLVRLLQLRFKILHTCLHIHYWKWWVLIHMIGNQYWFIWSYDYWILQYSYNTVQSRKILENWTCFCRETVIRHVQYFFLSSEFRQNWRSKERVKSRFYWFSLASNRWN